MLCVFIGLSSLFGGTNDTASVYDVAYGANNTSDNFAHLVVWVAIGAGCFAYFYFRLRGLHARVFEYGFVITRGDNTTSYRWQDIANVQQRVRTLYIYFFIPTFRSRFYAITLTGGQTIKVGSSFSNANSMGESIQQLWTRTRVQQLLVQAAQQAGIPGVPLPVSQTAQLMEAPVPIPQIASPSSPSASQVILTPSGLQYVDVVMGSGPEARPGLRISGHYASWLTDGTKLDNSMDRGQPFQFVLGQGQVIQGLDEGMAGMRAGGKRRLTIPPSLAYGTAGAGVIPPNATLIFDVDLLSVG